MQITASFPGNSAIPRSLIIIIAALSGPDRATHLFGKFPFWVNEVIRRMDHQRRLRITRKDMRKRKENPHACIAISGLNDHHPDRPVSELRLGLPLVGADDHGDFTLRLSQPIRPVKHVMEYRSAAHEGTKLFRPLTGQASAK